LGGRFGGYGHTGCIPPEEERDLMPEIRRHAGEAAPTELEPYINRAKRALPT
jgi:hypothetical protein